MLVTYSWLKDYVDFDLDAPALGHRLTMAGLEVEDLRPRHAGLDKVVAARVVSAEKHPHADKLTVCRVSDGRQEFQVVCGAPNVRAGLTTALAYVGAVLPGGETLKTGQLRGVASEGMLVSESELLLGDDAAGIMELDDSQTLGAPLAQALGLEDWVFELGVTPNRPDCLSLIGVAREISAFTGAPLRLPEIRFEETGPPATELTSIQIEDPDHCPRYVGRVVQNLKIGPSPAWLASRLVSVGVRPINNVVDITNYVLFELGQPLHAFDLHRLEEQRIVVSLAAEGQRFTTLDGVERVLGPEMLMINDGKKPVALAGVMGGLNSEIEETTRDVLLESAYFWPIGIRRTSKALSLSTEASFRFERGIDPEGCLLAADRAAMLMAQLAGGRVAKGALDVYPRPVERRVLPFRPARCNAFLGTQVPEMEMTAALESIGLAVKQAGDEYEVEPPALRVDLEREVDLYEEVARLVGYDQIPVSMPANTTGARPISRSRAMRARARQTLRGLGFSEAINYSFIDAGFCDQLGLPGEDPRRQVVSVLNPLSETQSRLRTTLLPGLLESMRRNHSHQVTDVALFEIGMTFFEREGQELPEERLAIAALLTGNRFEPGWNQPEREADFFDLKGAAEELLEALGVAGPQFAAGQTPAYLAPGEAALIRASNRLIGSIGRLSQAAAKGFDLRKAPLVFELDLAAILELEEPEARFAALPKFPSVMRDMALVLDRAVPAGEVTSFIDGLQEQLLVETAIFDVYEGDQVASGKKSLALRLIYRHPERTLTDEEVNQAHEALTRKVLTRFEAALRA